MAAQLWFSGVRPYLKTTSWSHSFPAVSGKARRSELGLSFSYSPGRQADKDSGPLPQGDYLIRLADVIEYRHTGSKYLAAAFAAVSKAMSFVEYLEKYEKAWGKMPGATGRILPIRTPDGSTDYAYGRNRCWIHGSDAPGSIGCIDLTTFMDPFLAAIAQTGTPEIPLKVTYGLSPTGREANEVDGFGRDISNTA